MGLSGSPLTCQVTVVLLKNQEYYFVKTGGEEECGSVYGFGVSSQIGF